MRLTIRLALALIFALALSASADMLTAPTWTAGTTESFTDYDPPTGTVDPENISYIGKVLGQSSGGQRNCSYDPWANQYLPQFRGEKLGGDNAERLDYCSTSFHDRCAWRGMPGCTPEESFNRVSFRIKSTATTFADYTIQIIASNNASTPYGSNAVPLWDISNLTVRPHVRTSPGPPPGSPEWIGPDVAINDGLWHWLDVCYSLTTGEAEWYKDGLLVGTMPLDPLLQLYYVGRNAEFIEFWQDNNGVLVQSGGAIWVDDFTFLSGEPIPEPSSLLALGTFGIGMLGLIRRRRA